MGIMKHFEAIPNAIWAKTCEREFDQYVAFRKDFATDTEGIVTLRLFANTYYNLYVDGVFLHRGPIRRHERCAEFDELSCYLKAGRHTVAVLVHWIGVEAAAHRNGKASFWMESEGCGAAFITDESWKAKFLNSFESDGELITFYDFRENVDLRLFPTGWNTIGFDDSSWENAVPLWLVGSSDDYISSYSLRQMKLFSYIWEKGKVLQRGRYTEMVGAETYFFERMLQRLFSANGKDGSYAVIGFEMTVSGTAVVRYSGAKSGDELLLGYDDMLNENGLPMPNRMMRYGDRFLLSEGDGEFEVFMPRGFRYLLVELSGAGRVEEVLARKEEYPYLPQGFSRRFFFANLYQQCLRTQHICTIDGYTDCVNRERVLWLGDAWIDTMSAYYAEPDKGLLLTTMYEHAMGQVATGAIGGYNSSDCQPDWLHMPSYNMMFLHMLCDYVLFTGRVEDILPLKETAKGILHFIDDNINANGLYDSRYKGQGDFWDWGGAEAPGQQLKTSAFFVYTVERLSKFNELRDLAEPYLSRLEPIREACRRIFWDEKRRVFLDACLLGEVPEPICTQQGNALAILADICPSELQDELMERILDPKELDRVPVGENQDGTQFVFDKRKISPPGTMFAAMFVAIMLFEKKRYDLAIPYMRQVWGPYQDLPTLPELRHNGPNNTMCHGWSGGPGYLIPRYLVGIYPDEYAWKTVTLIPPSVTSDEFPSAGARITTPYGEMIVQWSSSGDSLCVSAILPEETKLTVLWKEKRIALEKSMVLMLLA